MIETPWSGGLERALDRWQPVSGRHAANDNAKNRTNIRAAITGREKHEQTTEAMNELGLCESWQWFPRAYFVVAQDSRFGKTSAMSRRAVMRIANLISGLFLSIAVSCFAQSGVEVRVNFAETTGPLKINQMALGQGGLSDKVMWDDRIAEIRA